MKTLIITGKYMYALPMLIFGIMHLVYADTMAAAVPDYFYGGSFWVYLTGVGLLGSAICIFLNRYVRITSYLLALMLMVFVFTIHLPSVVAGGEGAQMALISLMKDFALAGAAVLIGAISEEAKD